MAWFFLRIPGCETVKSVRKFKRDMKLIGAVCSCALGTAVDADAGWFVVRTDVSSVAGLRTKLEEVGLSGYVDIVEPLVRPKDGFTLARQLALF